MPIVYDDAPSTAASIQYDQPAASQGVFEHGAPPLAGFQPPAPDKYQQAAIAERDRLVKAGVPLPEGYTRRVMSGPLLGWGDEIAAAGTAPLEMIRHGTFNPAEGYRYAKAREDLAGQAAQQKTGMLGDAAELTGALTTLPGNVFARGLSAAIGGGGKGVLPAAARMAGYGAEAGTLGAVQGAGNAQTINDIPRQALAGGVLGAALGAPFGALANVAPRSTAVVPRQSELMALGARDYKARDKVPVSYDLEHLANRMRDVGQATRNKYGRDTPETVNKLRNLADEAYADVASAKALNPNAPNPVAVPGQTGPNPWMAVATPRDIASLRGEIYDAGAKGSGRDERAGLMASKIIPRVLTRPDPASLASGNARDAAAAALLDQRGRGNFSAAYRDRGVTDAIEKSTADAAKANSGLNFENSLRKNFDSAKRRSDFGTLNAEQEAALERLTLGTAKANRIRETGNTLGGGGGPGRALVMGGGAGGGALTAYLTGNDPWTGAALGFGLGQVGRGLRTYGNAQAGKAANEFSELIRKDSPEYARRAAVAPMGPGPGLGPYSTAAATSKTLALGGDGGIRDAIANSILYNATGKRNALNGFYNPDQEQQ